MSRRAANVKRQTNQTVTEQTARNKNNNKNVKKLIGWYEGPQ